MVEHHSMAKEVQGQANEMWEGLGGAARCNIHSAKPS